MAKQIVGLGTTPNDGTGDNLRIAGAKVNDNFTELYDSKLLTEKKIDIVVNATTTALSLGTLNTDYPSMENGFRVLCALISGGGLVYIKVTGGWVSSPITTVV